MNKKSFLLTVGVSTLLFVLLYVVRVMYAYLVGQLSGSPLLSVAYNFSFSAIVEAHVFFVFTLYCCSRRKGIFSKLTDVEIVHAIILGRLWLEIIAGFSHVTAEFVFLPIPVISVIAILVGLWVHRTKSVRHALGFLIFSILYSAFIPVLWMRLLM